MPVNERRRTGLCWFRKGLALRCAQAQLFKAPLPNRAVIQFRGELGRGWSVPVRVRLGVGLQRYAPGFAPKPLKSRRKGANHVGGGCKPSANLSGLGLHLSH